MLDPKNTTAREIMNEDVLTFEEDEPLKEAIDTLEEYGISGAPVVNAAGECVGVFSRADALKRQEEVDSGEAPFPGGLFMVEPPPNEEAEPYATGDWPRGEYDREVLGPDTVGQWMNSNFKCVSPDATVEEVARCMIEEGVRRVLVMNGHSLRGIISTFDIVRVVAGKKAEKGQRVARRL
jgi:CBS domain-containing protein